MRRQSFAEPGPTPRSDAPVRVVVREVPVPGEEPRLGEAEFDDVRSIAVARKARPGGYLRLRLEAARALGRSVILLEKLVQGTTLVLRVRLFPRPAYVRAR